MASQVTGIEFLSKTLNKYANELSFAGRELKLNTRQDAKELVDTILNQKTMQVLRLEGNTISPEAAEELAKALAKHPELERLIANDIFTGRLKDEIPLALKSICGAITSTGAHLVELNMCDNAFGPIGLEGLVSFLQSSACYTLTELRLHNNGLGTEGAKKLAKALEQCYLNSDKIFALKVFVCGRNRLEFDGSKAISAVLKQIGTLEEIHMPQNGIRPNGIEFIADACAHNKSLRIINLNDNTFRKPGGDCMARALTELKNLEYVNFGDCLLKSKGAVQIAKAISNSKNIKEVILGFNEISLQAGLEIAQAMLKNVGTLTLLDLNGNKFGDEGKLEIASVLSPLGAAFNTMSEDEGSDEEDEEGEDDENGDEDESDEQEQDESGELVGEDEYEDYDEDDEDDVEYDDDDDEDDEGEYDDEEGEYDDEGDENDAEYDEEADAAKKNEAKPNANLFASMTKPPFGQAISFNQLANSNQQSKTSNSGPSSNPFANLVKNKHLFTANEPFNKFLTTPSVTILDQFDDTVVTSVCEDVKFNGMFLMQIYNILAPLLNENNNDSKRVLNFANTLTQKYLSKSEHIGEMIDAVLIYSGVLKNEEKSFRPAPLSDEYKRLLKFILSDSKFPKQIRDQLTSYIKLRSLEEPKSETVKYNSQWLFDWLSSFTN